MKPDKKEDEFSSPKSNKEDDKKFPGYPHYPKEEDAFANPDLSAEDLEDLTSEIPEVVLSPNPATEIDYSTEAIPGNEADVTEEEEEDLAREGGLQDRDYHPDELDVPGSELDDEKEVIGEEDEENNYYSLGGDDKENLEENPDR